MSAEFGPQFRVALGNRGAPPRAAGSAQPSHDSAAWRSDLLLVPHDNRTFQLFDELFRIGHDAPPITR